jgi:hypothetical protein
MHNSTIKPKPPKQKVCLCPCGEKFTPTALGQKWVNREHHTKWLLDTEEGREARKKQFAKDLKQQEKAKNKEIQSWKPSTHEKKYTGHLQNGINKLARLIDAKFGYSTCIDCGNYFGDQCDGAHFTGVGGNHSTRYNLHNIHSARAHCNKYSDKHKQGYTIGLKERYGESYLTLVEELPIKYKYIKISAVEVVEKLKIVRSLVKNFDTFQAENSIAMRENFNNIIGIYGNNE